MPTANNKAFKFAPFDENIATMEAVIEGLGISAYRLGVLIGMKHPQNAYQWASGYCRPNQATSIRILRLVCMAAFDKVKLPLVERIDWDTGEITYKGALNDKSSNQVSSGQRTVSRGERRNGDPLSYFYSERS